MDFSTELLVSVNFGFSLLVFLASFLGIVSSPLPADEADICGAYERLRDGMYNDQPLAVVQLLYSDALQQVDAASLPYGRDNLWHSRIEYMIARAYQRWGHADMAIYHYECGMVFAEQAIASGLGAEGCRMKSEHLGQLCVLKNLGFLLANAHKVREHARRALDLDPDNVSCQIILAAEKIYSPRMFGGDALEGIELMQQALRMGTSDKDDLFNIYSGIGLAYSKLHDYEAASIWFGKALQIYPNNCYAKEQYRSNNNRNQAPTTLVPRTP